MNRESIFSLRLSISERELLEDLARSSNRKPSEFMRELLRTHSDRRKAQQHETAQELAAKN